MRTFLVSSLLFLLVFAGAASAADWEPVTITDDLGVTVTIDKYPERIVSLSPANTEILFALGLGDRIVGVTEYCTYPEAALSKDKIGGFSTINTEKIAVLNPDLLVAADGNSEETIAHLRELGYTIITVNADTIDTTLADIRLIGKAAGVDSAAEELVSSMQADLAEIAEKTKGAEKPTILHCMWTDPLWVSGSGTFQDEMISAAGGVNAAAAEGGWVALTMEKFLTMNPDIIVVDSGDGMGVGTDDALKNFFLKDSRMQSLSAVQNERVYVVNADIIDRGGPRIVEGVEALAEIAHPDIFGEYGGNTNTVVSPGFGILGVLAGLCVCLAVRRK
ncbi:MAG TPA: cobalamin-binding protein [Methanocorpusculum sp.]|nr:cobalamin-binding protein [Methanocorpusculum sp.]